ncbi:hypothetical protein Scep_003461 [Stephania cephalantha]|uniref:FAF domain-containing protein n=1 Tax=Stephania cephalantha TaxID=152367 RepID=A0AAP0KSJ5_9MAGN
MQNMSSTSVKCYKGLGTILFGAPEHPRSSASSLRRTLSADMSSKKWLAQNGFSSSSSPIKKTASTEQLRVDNNNCNSNESQPSQLDIWNAIQADRHKAEQKQNQKQSDVWGSLIIVSQKSSPIPAPYVHPLSNKRSRSLSQRSLEICTESLGSETGSDGYSSSCDAEQEQQDHMEEELEKEVEYFLGRKPTHQRRSFPPPLPSLSRPGIHMRPRRVDGRLVLEAVSIPPTPSHNFHAQRQDGRLLLTFANPPPKNEKTEEKQQSQNQNRQVVFGNDMSEIVVEMMRPTVLAPTTGVIDAQLSAYRMKKLMTLTNMNPTTPASPRVPRMISSSAAASFNTYEYYWRTNKTTISLGIKGTLIQQPSLLPFSTTTTTTTTSLGTNKSYTNRSLLVTKNLNPQQQQQQQQQHVHLHQFVVLQPNCMDSTLRGCKDSRRTSSALLFRDPCCIATS